MYFLCHEQLEDSGGGVDGRRDEGLNSKENSHEAALAVKIARHLMYNGYTSEQITILSMYKAQARLIKLLAAAESKLTQQGDVPVGALSDIRVTTTDNYQVSRACA